MIEMPHHAIQEIQTGVSAGLPLDGGGSALTYILPLVAALVISMVLIPLMVHFAPHIGMVDLPDERKVHAKPIPRVGGFGIVLGALLPVVLLLPLEQPLLAYVAGALVLFVFGALDDSLELGHYVKFIGQFVAVIIIVYIGDVYVTRLPFLGVEAVSESIGRPFTVFAMVGMINAINHSDGLDGLAGGESLISLCAIAYLAYAAGGSGTLTIALAIIGGLLGFMRFNTYPAVIFMGDSGSQFLGLSLGYLAVQLTQDVNTALSPALPLLLLGLPIADIIAVFFQRIYKKMNWFRATRNHVHHRLLDLGFHHYESVIIIYALQLLLVVSAVVLLYESDILVAGLYIFVVAMLFILLHLAERCGVHIHAIIPGSSVDEIVATAKHSQLPGKLARSVILLGMSLFLVTGSIIATSVPMDLGLVGLVLCMMLLARLVFGKRLRVLPLRLLSYMAIVFVVYLLNTYQPPYLAGADPFTYIFFGCMALASVVMIRYTEKIDFSITPTDFLIIIAVSSLVVLSGRGIIDSGLSAITMKSIILFYACELLLNKMDSRWNVFTLSVLFALLTIGVRGLLPPNL